MIGIDLLASATEYLCGLLVLVAFFPLQEKKKWIQICAMIFFGIIHIGLSMLPGDWLLPKTALILINWVFASRVCFAGSVWKEILIILSFWAVAFAVDILVLSVCTAIMNESAKQAISENASFLLSVLASRSILLSISFGCSYIVRRQNQKQAKTGAGWIYLLLIPLYTIMAIGGLISNAILDGGELSNGVIILSGGLLVINILLCTVVNRLEQIRESEAERQRLQTEAAHNLDLAKNYQDSFNEQRKITHEFQNQLAAVDDLLFRKEYDRAAGYVRHLRKTTHEIIPAIRTNHPIADAVLNQKYQQAVQKGVGMLLFCNDLSGIPMEDGDLVTLLGNILDNAVAASAQTQEKDVWVRLWQEQGAYQFTVRNCCLEKPAVRSPYEERYHGFGTGLATAVLDKYRYPYSATQEGTTYIFSTILG